MTIYTNAISKLIQDEKSVPIMTDDYLYALTREGYLAGLVAARDAVAKAEEELQRRLPAIYEEYGVPFA